MGQPADEGARAPDASPGGSDRPERARDRRHGNRRHRPADPPDQKRADPPRLAQLRILRRGVPADERQDLPGRRQDAQLHPGAAGGRLRAGVAVERAVYDRHLEGRALSGLRQYRGAEDVRALPSHRRPSGRARPGGGYSGGRVQRGAGLRRDGRRCAGAASRRARGLLHRRHRHRAQHHEKRRAEEVLHGAGRQIPGADF